MLTASSHAVNLTDGLDGLAAGSSALVFAAYVFIAFWQFRHLCFGAEGIAPQRRASTSTARDARQRDRGGRA